MGWFLLGGVLFGACAALWYLEDRDHRSVVNRRLARRAVEEAMRQEMDTHPMDREGRVPGGRLDA